MSDDLNAYDDLLSELRDDEDVEGIVFGGWGWSYGTDELGYGEPDPPIVPFDKRGVVMSLDRARPLMAGWSFYGSYGAPTCYAVTAWTNERVLWVTQYDGSTGLSSAERNPKDYWPDMPGG